MAVFYRTYRPQKFSEVVGQQPIVTTLKNAVKNGTVAHAYLFCGSRGVGKTTVARILAKAVNCLNVKDGEACGQCEVCQAIQNNLFIDLVEIDAASHTGVDNVRELIEHIKFKPTTARFKVFIVDEVHMLSKAAFNALLKTLEEPPEHAIFILATTDVHKVPATIISRTQRYEFSRITASDIVGQLKNVAKQEGLKLDDPILHLVARQASGSLRDALSLLNKVASAGKKVSLVEAELLLGSTGIAHSQKLTELLIAGEPAPIPDYISGLEQEGIDFTVFNRNFLEYLRALLVLKVAGAAPADYLPEEIEVMEPQASRLTTGQILHWLRLFLRSYKDLAVAPEPSLALLMAGMEAVVKPEAPSSSGAAPKPGAPKLATAEVKRMPREKPTAAASSPELNTFEEEIEEAPAETRGETEITAEAYDPYTLTEVQQFWPQVITKLKQVNSPLATLVKNSPVTGASQNGIVISVKYLFHKEHLESKKIHGMLLDAITECGGRPARLRIEIGAVPETEVPTSADAIGEVLRVFGGELVE